MRTSCYNAEEMIPRALELMRNGASKIEVASELGVSRQTLYDWCDPAKTYYQKDFRTAIELGETHSQAYWEKRLRFSVDDKNINLDAVKFALRTRFGYSETQPAAQAGFVINWPLGKSKLDR